MTDARRAGSLTAAWGLVVLVFAVVPTHDALSSTVGEREDLTTEIGHFAEFAVLAALAMWWVTEWRRARPGRGVDRGAQPGEADAPWIVTAVTVWTATVAYGALIEAIQAPLGYRSAQVGDLALDAAGALIGLLAFSCVRVVRARARRARGR